MNTTLFEYEVNRTIEKPAGVPFGESVEWQVYSWGRRFGVAVCIDGVMHAMTIDYERVLCSSIESAVHAAEIYVLGKPWC